MARVENPDLIESRRKAIFVLFPYAVWQERVGDHPITDEFLDVVRVSNVGSFIAYQITTLLRKADPHFPNRLVTLMSPYVDWGRESDTNTVARCAEVVAVAYT